MKQWYVLEMNGFTEEEAQEFFAVILKDVDWNGRGIKMSHLTDKGVADLKKYVFKEKNHD